MDLADMRRFLAPRWWDFPPICTEHSDTQFFEQFVELPPNCQQASPVHDASHGVCDRDELQWHLFKGYIQLRAKGVEGPDVR